MNESVTQTTEAPAPLASGEKTTGTVPEASPATLAAGAEALNLHATENGKRGRGRPITHGKYAGKGKSKTAPREIPLAPVDNGSAPLLLEESPTPPVSVGTEEIHSDFDEEANRECADLIVSCLIEINNLRQKRKILAKTGNEELAEFVMEKRTVPESPRKLMKVGFTGCLKKWGIDTSKSPETCAISGLVSWQVQESAQTKNLIDQYFKLRPAEKPPT